jgi:hypothetical protein
MAEIGISPFKTSIPDLDDAADIQTAFRLYHYGIPTEPTPGNPSSSDSIQSHLERIQSSLDAGTSISTIDGTTDLNNVLVSGLYHQPQTPIADRNYPTLQAGLLSVYVISSTVVFQTYQTVPGGSSTNNRLYIRSRTSSGWGSWRGLADINHLHDDEYYQKTTIDSRLNAANLQNANRAAIIDSTGRVSFSSAITTTELDQLDGVTSNVQAQLNNRYVKSETARVFVQQSAPTTGLQVNDIWLWG